MPKDVTDVTPVQQATVLNHPSAVGPISKVPHKADKDFAAKRAEALKDFLGQSTLLSGASSGDVPSVLSQISRYLARNIEIMEFKREMADATGADATQLVVKQSDLLKQLASIQFELRKVKADTIDLNSPQFLRISKFFVDTVVESAKECLQPEHVDIFVQKLAADMEGFTDKLEAHLTQNKLQWPQKRLLPIFSPICFRRDTGKSSRKPGNNSGTLLLFTMAPMNPHGRQRAAFSTSWST